MTYIVGFNVECSSWRFVHLAPAIVSELPSTTGPNLGYTPAVTSWTRKHHQLRTFIQWTTTGSAGLGLLGVGVNQKVLHAQVLQQRTV